jgi:hypothetical protein
MKIQYYHIRPLHNKTQPPFQTKLNLILESMIGGGYEYFQAHILLKKLRRHSELIVDNKLGFQGRFQQFIVRRTNDFQLAKLR